MAVKLIANYSKRLGLPGYSSHQFSVSVETELNTSDDLSFEAARLYENLQANVDEQIRQTGFVPDAGYGMETNTNGSGHDNEPAPGKVLSINSRQNTRADWQCSPKQQDLILKLIKEHNLDKNEVEQLARQRFRKGVPQLNKMEASGLIDQIIQEHSQAPSSGQRSANYQKGGQR